MEFQKFSLARFTEKETFRENYLQELLTYYHNVVNQITHAHITNTTSEKF